MDSVMGNEYGHMSVLQNIETYKVRKEEYLPKPSYLPKITKSVMLAKDKTWKKLEHFEDPNAKSAFKMKKFLNVNHKIDDFNDGYIQSRGNSTKSHHGRSLSFDPRHQRLELTGVVS